MINPKDSRQDTSPLEIHLDPVLWFMAHGWEVSHCPPSACFTDETNRNFAWNCRRTEAPFCTNKRDGARQWSGPTPTAALAASVADLGTESRAIAALADRLQHSPTGASEAATSIPETLQCIKALASSFFSGDDQSVKAAGRLLIEIESLATAAMVGAQADASTAIDPATPAYEADDGPLTVGEFDELRMIASANLPKGGIVKKRSLF